MKAHGHDDAYGGHPGGFLERAYAATARPLLRSKSGALAFLLVTAVLSFGSLAALYTRDVTVKLLPFDNKSELSVIIDLPEGSSTEATDRVAQDVAPLVMALPECRLGPHPRGHRRALQTSTASCGTTPPPGTPPGRGGNPPRPKADRDRTSHAIALDIRERLKSLTLPPGTVLKTVEPPPGPPVMAHPAGRGLRPHPRSRREAATKIRQAFESVPFVVDVDDSFGIAPRRLRATISTDQLEFLRRAGTGRVRHAGHPERRPDRRLFPPRRRALSLPLRLELPKGDRTSTPPS